MDLDTPVSFFLPSRQDEGVFPLALLMRLGEEHNELVRHSHDVSHSVLKENHRNVHAETIALRAEL